MSAVKPFHNILQDVDILPIDGPDPAEYYAAKRAYVRAVVERALIEIFSYPEREAERLARQADERPKTYLHRVTGVWL